jgi:hypothetical protein
MNPARSETGADCRQTAWSSGERFGRLFAKLWRVGLKTWNVAKAASDQRLVPFQCAIVHDFNLAQRRWVVGPLTFYFL